MCMYRVSVHQHIFKAELYQPLPARSLLTNAFNVSLLPGSGPFLARGLHRKVLERSYVGCVRIRDLPVDPVSLRVLVRSLWSTHQALERNTLLAYRSRCRSLARKTMGDSGQKN